MGWHGSRVVELHAGVQHRRLGQHRHRQLPVFEPDAVVSGGVAGILVGAVWNYAVSQIYTWGKVK